MLEAVEVSKKYWDRSSGRQYDVLQSCSLQIAAGEAVGMMGPSGCRQKYARQNPAAAAALRYGTNPV